VTRAWCDPSTSIIQMASSRMKAMRRPSGDHCGSEADLSVGGQLLRVAAADGHEEYLAGAGGLRP